MRTRLGIGGADAQWSATQLQPLWQPDTPGMLRRLAGVHAKLAV